MGRFKVFLVLCAVLFINGAVQLIGYSEKLLSSSENVRLVHVIGLSGSGVTCGATLIGFIALLKMRRRTPTEAQKPPQEQPAV